ncbi:hypothetical protein CL628_02315 [bacterium]|nr:hypothetical protein [bacterium]
MKKKSSSPTGNQWLIVGGAAAFILVLALIAIAVQPTISSTIRATIPDRHVDPDPGSGEIDPLDPGGDMNETDPIEEHSEFLTELLNPEPPEEEPHHPLLSLGDEEEEEPPLGEEEHDGLLTIVGPPEEEPLDTDLPPLPPPLEPPEEDPHDSILSWLWPW